MSDQSHRLAQLAAGANEGTAAAITNGNRLLWRKRTLYAAAAFGLICASVYPYVDGRHLTSGEESIKQVLLFAWLILVVVLLYCVLLLWGAFCSVRDLRDDRNLP